MAGPGNRIIVKMLPRETSLSLSMGQRKVSFSHEPLMPDIDADRVRAAGGQAAAPTPSWHMLTEKSSSDLSPWDLCHALMGRGDMGLTGAERVEYAEPDILQSFKFASESDLARIMADACGNPDDPDKDYPHPKDDSPYWYRTKKFSELAAAADAVGDPGDGNRIRIAHLDTGYDPNHKTLPRHIDYECQRNFVDKDRPNDAAEIHPKAGLLKNPGHGTGTLGILAGKSCAGPSNYGGAPYQGIVPIRVAKGVVLFYTSAIAKALNYVYSLHNDPKRRIDVITMSMGGLASRAWAEAVNALYEAGVFVVTASGNNYCNLPTRHVVYPARFNRVVAACGMMYNRKPYADQGLGRMAGNYGPAGRMRTAMAAYTPNTPWARIGCERIVDKDGAGTSSATPQIAAAAALWLQRHRQELADRKYRGTWRQVEAVREALFSTAAPVASAHDRERLGHGPLKALAALGRAPADDLTKEDEDKVRFPLLTVLFGARAGGGDMVEVEAMQLVQKSRELELLLPDPEVPFDRVSMADKERIFTLLETSPGASRALKSRINAVRGWSAQEDPVTPEGRQRKPSAPDETPSGPGHLCRLHMLEQALDPPLPWPVSRTLHVYTFDPLSTTHLETKDIAVTRLEVPWEKDLKPGPVGEYLEVVDIDPATGCCYAPVDLNARQVLAAGGVPPSESNPRFHQQMVYAWAMRTIQLFETALGRKAFWAPKFFWEYGGRGDTFIRRLRIHPHALREANAYYSKDKAALLFGYFTTSESPTGENLPGGTVFTCLSHDIVAHETAHALLDGLHRRYSEGSGPDGLAFHEAFADIVALFQHFTLPDALVHQISATRGDLADDSLLAKLAVQFGKGIGQYGALRNAIGSTNDKGEFEPAIPTPGDYKRDTEPHALGSVLVSAVFDAFLQVYDKRRADLMRLATGGTGILPEGAIPNDLAGRLAREASDTAEHILTICIRALDYCPPVNITFGDYLRALITADHDLVPDDVHGYRCAFISAFRRRGIYPEGVNNLSEESLRWNPPCITPDGLEDCFKGMELNWDMLTDRETAYQSSRKNAKTLHDWLVNNIPASHAREYALEFGFIPSSKRKWKHVIVIDGKEHVGDLHGFEVHSVRPARRIGRDNEQLTEIVVEITQRWVSRETKSMYRGGCTAIVDYGTGKVRYCIRMGTAHPKRVDRQMRFEKDQRGRTLRSMYFHESDNTYEAQMHNECFAMIHRDL